MRHYLTRGEKRLALAYKRGASTFARQRCNVPGCGRVFDDDHPAASYAPHLFCGRHRCQPRVDDSQPVREWRDWLLPRSNDCDSEAYRMTWR